MGRTKNADGVESAARQATIERLIQATTKVIAEKGYGGTTVQDIAAAAGLTTGAIYANFTSKDALIRRMVEEDGRGTPEEHDRGHASLAALVDEIDDEAQRHGLDHRASTRFWMEVLARSLSDETLYEQVETSTRLTVDRMSEAIDDAVEGEGRTSAFSTQELARIFRGLGWGLSVMGLFDPKLSSARTRKQLVLQVLDRLAPKG